MIERATIRNPPRDVCAATIFNASIIFTRFGKTRIWMHRELLVPCNCYKQSFVTSAARNSICLTRDSDYITLSPIRKAVTSRRMRENALRVTRGARYHSLLCTDDEVEYQRLCSTHKFPWTRNLFERDRR